ncbi:hypothetical protein BD780_001317 [Clostridium tetanomorphum]|uniref:DUF1835 domain-containing protein n=1 Tax=Clostridium tetanomorphum TaxID=1553 RepID=A0A923E7P1_CLOTT|nr:DUF1835 domain-containing protein [Clostridium tetanomorphum]KAJ53570.1 hypothetical protein CTM_01764 [Clostridium tetanomorphum DSM 665]MBC2398057.1 DUF1835 domain-containing protein [Clostridium tetanomorphum]MBP1864623.1 hypothetical protein [Clostridium tetanomorphum]NRS84092.1 hypothetical protein [Clostridium tetanomorphum]NRZ97306.1 hypothetical protein [Clostridium tetanomorphum]
MGNLIHICFSASASGSLKYALKTNLISGNKSIDFFDDLSNGPIYGKVDLGDRINWCKKLIKEYKAEYIEDLRENYYKFNKKLSKITSEDTVYFWIGNNASELVALMYTLEKLNLPLENMYIINVSQVTYNQGLINEFTPRSVGEVSSNRLSEILETKKKIKKETYNSLLNNWNKIKEEKGKLRIYKDGQVITVKEDYFDNQILKYTPKEFRKCARVVGKTIGYSEKSISDYYIFLRIQQLIKNGLIEYKGNFKLMREMEVKISN